MTGAFQALNPGSNPGRRILLFLQKIIHKPRLLFFVVVNIIIAFLKNISVREEFGTEHSTYYEIVSAIAQGKCSMKKISEMTHVFSSSLPPYFYDLINLLEVVEHSVPVSNNPQKSKRGLYFLKENFFRFYGSFIYPTLSQYMAGNDAALKNKVLQKWQSYTGKLFEDMVRELITEEMIAYYPQIGTGGTGEGTRLTLSG